MNDQIPLGDGTASSSSSDSHLVAIREELWQMRIASDSRWDELQRQLHDRRKEARVYYLCLFGSLLGIMFLLMGKR
jgi:hypothetical protein